MAKEKGAKHLLVNQTGLGFEQKKNTAGKGVYGMRVCSERAACMRARSNGRKERMMIMMVWGYNENPGE